MGAMIVLIVVMCLAGFVLPAGGAGDREKAASDSVAPGAPDRALGQTIETLVRDLGDRRYAVRQKAADGLRRIGYPAVAALEKAAQSDDPEVADTALAILKDARLGITPAWPRTLADDARRYRLLGAAERSALVHQVIAGVKEEAMPFLLFLLDSGTSADGKSVNDALAKADNARIAERLAAALKEPRNEWQARAAAWAFLKLDQPKEALRVLAACRLDGGPEASRVIEKAIETLRRLIRDHEPEKAATMAREFAASAPTEARFLYLQGAALRRQGKDPEARELEDKAVQLHPAEEGPHYTAGDLLVDLGLDEVSAREWNAILKIPPAGDVYDINAYLRLGQIAQRGGRPGDAAGHFESALKLYRQRKAGGHGGYGIAGLTEDQLEALIGRLRQDGGGGAGEGPIVAGERGKQISVKISPVVKNDRGKDLDAATKACAAFLSVNVEPAGFRLLDLKECRLSYDREKEEIAVLLNNAPAGKPLRHPAGTRKTRVAVTSLDCTYIYEVDPGSGEVKAVDRFEKDYRIRIVPDDGLKAFKGSDLKIGESTVSWEELLKGTTIDYLPPVLEIRMEGPGTNAAPEILTFTIELKEWPRR